MTEQIDPDGIGHEQAASGALSMTRLSIVRCPISSYLFSCAMGSGGDPEIDLDETTINSSAD
jgi:hypothetical protein